MIRKAPFTLQMLTSVALLASCGPAQTTSAPVPNMPNPAAVYCEQQGGRSEIVTAADGSQSGLCIFPDGSKCDEWAYFRGECKPGDSAVTPRTTASPSPVSAAPTPTPLPTAMLVLTVTPAPTATSLPQLVIDDTWATYKNAKYGFSFRYPSDWNLEEITGSINTMSGHAVHLNHPANPAVKMIIAFRHADEEARIAPTGMGGGELVSRGVVSLLGQEVERLVRVEREKDMAVYYGWPRSAVTGDDLVFWLALDCACSPGDPGNTGLTPEMEQVADAISRSIEVTK